MNLTDDRKYTILIVDDDEDMLWLMQQRLLHDGYNPLLSPNAVNIMDIITQRHPDLVLLDIHMKGVDGGDICKAIKSAPSMKEVPIILFSANDNIESISADCGADGFMSKPFDSGHFHELVERIITKAS